MLLPQTCRVQYCETEQDQKLHLNLLVDRKNVLIPAPQCMYNKFHFFVFICCFMVMLMASLLVLLG